jgi:light-independent protochlorophyllide reductase subunit B
MQLTLWTYEGPPHVGAMRVATSMRDVHYVLHAPQGDTYADLLFTMIERRDRRPPVTYTTFQARDLGGDTANLVTTAVREAYERFKPNALLVGESCTAEIIQDQPGALAMGMQMPVPVVPLELPAYSKKENWGASETFYHLVRTLLLPQAPPPGWQRPPRGDRRPRANLLGFSALGFRTRDDIREVKALLESIGVEPWVVAPEGATVEDLRRLPEADVNLCLVPEVALTTVGWLERTFKMPSVRIVPIGVGATRDFLQAVGAALGLDVSAALDAAHSRLPWYSRSVDSTYLTGKRVFIFGDGSHVIAAARLATEELAFTVVGLGTYSREMAREVRAAAQALGLEALISDDYLEVERTIADLQPELVLGTQMERHIAKRLGVPCAVISAPFHVQDVPARHSPQMGWEGANVIFDTWVHPLMMGLEEHLLTMFREDFEFRDDAAPSHLRSAGHEAVIPQRAAPAAGTAAVADAPEAVAPDPAWVTGGASLDEAPVAGAAPPPDVLVSAASAPASVGAAPSAAPAGPAVWSPEAQQELGKIPFFVRGKARRNTEKFAAAQGLATISVDTLYEAKAHYGK